MLVPVHAAGEHRPAALFRYNFILQKSQNHGKRCKEDQKGLLPDSKDPLSSSEEARPAWDDNTAMKPSLNSSKLTCEFEKSGQHCFLQATYVTHWALRFSQMEDLILPSALRTFIFSNISVQFSSFTQSCPTLWDPMNRSTPGLPVHHQLPEFTQTNVHQVGDAIQPSHPLSSPSPPAPNPSQHQSLFQWVNSSHEVAKGL